MKPLTDFMDKVICGDCLEVMKEIPDNSVDLVVTDVPYNLGDTDSELIKFKDRENMNKASIDSWNKGFNPIGFLPKIKRVLKKNGNIFIYTHHRHFGDYYKWLNDNFERVFFGVWHKTNPVPQVRKVSFLSACELFICAWNKGHKWNFETQKTMHNFIETPICMGKERVNHTAQKPIAAMIPLIKSGSKKGDTILDPFLGSGTTAVACKQLNRHFIGIEINPDYCEMARKRIQAIPKRLDKFMVNTIKENP